ncbi:MAG: hypothetical protein PHQ05_14350 [Sterolibacterium sp.]|nr:hypothetical protein [Sterolibacterium sp.]
MGPALRRRLLADAKEIIRVGIEQPDIFDLAGLFEEDIGPDRISDMVAGIIKVDLIGYTKRVFVELGVIHKGQPIPVNPYNNNPILLVPRDVLRDLPLALDWDDFALVASHNAALREEVNELIGSTWRKVANYASKKDVRDVMLKYPEILSDLIEQYRHKARIRYNFDEDRAGQVVWHEAANAAAAEHPLKLTLPEKPTIGNIAAVVTAICERFRHRKEALKVYKQVVKRFPDSQFAEEAKQVLNRAGQADLRKVVDDGYRPDAVEYMIGAMKRFSELPSEQVGHAVMEIAQLGQTGLEINNPLKRYSLTNLDGDFSGLQLLCYMHVGMALFDPGVDCGSGLQREYEIAKGMTGK